MSNETLKEFINNMSLKMKTEQIESNPNWDSNVQANHYNVQLISGDNRKTCSFPFSQGIGIKENPNINGVLECLQSDSLSGDFTFEGFCDEFGYDSDSRKAEKTFKACQETRFKLKKFFNGNFLRFLDADLVE